ncbi:MAG TPA: CUB domain-containing protein, partial [Flavobacteriales bacterium]|nr:CUB domain-containing protein [Flavobacteriales bacterium]
MKKLSYIVPFLLLILFGISPAKAQTYIMGAAGGTITDCAGTIENPGGYGTYVDGLDVVQTICSGNGQCIQLTFTDFGTESGYDYLTVYDGNSTLGAVLGSYTG